jgi:hypothetical protein
MLFAAAAVGIGVCALGAVATITHSSTEPLSPQVGTVSPATVPLEMYPPRNAATLTPDSLIIMNAMVGQTYMEHKSLFLPADVTPARGDILFLMDLTGSMGEELNNVKTNSINIMNAVRADIPDTDFGVMSHMDYDSTHSGCGYSNIYGSIANGDYAYSLDQPITSNLTNVSNAINGLLLGDGWDFPENYTRVLYETYADPTVGWRAGSKRIVLQWGDDVPHDCAYDACLGGSTTTGPDPGRNEIDNDGDDLAILPTLAGMAAENITLLPLHSGLYINLWDCYADETGGEAFQINSDGTIPGGVDIADFIVSIIGTEVAHIDVLTLAVCTPGYEDWLAIVSPASYTDIDLDEDQKFDFDIVIQVPLDATVGKHEFFICALGDGAEFARQYVSITVIPPVATEETSWGQMKSHYR